MCIFVKVYERRDTTNGSSITNKPKNISIEQFA